MGRGTEGRTYTDEQRGGRGRLWLKLSVFVPLNIPISTEMDARLNDLVREKFTEVLLELQERYPITDWCYQPPPTQVQIDDSRAVFVHLHTNSGAKNLKLECLRRSVGEAMAMVIDPEARLEWEAERELAAWRKSGRPYEMPDDAQFEEICKELLEDPRTEESLTTAPRVEPCGLERHVRLLESTATSAKRFS